MSVVSNLNVNPSITISNENPSITISKKNISLEVTLPSGAVVTVTGDFNGLIEAVDLLSQPKKEPVTSPEVPPAPLAQDLSLVPASTHVHGPFAKALGDHSLEDFPPPGTASSVKKTPGGSNQPAGSVKRIPGVVNPPEKLPLRATGFIVKPSPPPPPPSFTREGVEECTAVAVDNILYKGWGHKKPDRNCRSLKVFGPKDQMYTALFNEYASDYVSGLGNKSLSVSRCQVTGITFINVPLETPEPASVIVPASAKKEKPKKAKGTLPAGTVEKQCVSVSNSFGALSEPIEEISCAELPSTKLKASELDWTVQETDSDDSDSEEA
jgi:hypothetical protein